MIQAVQQPTYTPVKRAVKGAAAAAVTTGVVAAGLAIGAKKGVFVQGKNPILNKINPYLQNAGDFINANVAKAAEFVKGKAETIHIKDKIVKSGAYKKVKAGITSIGNKIKGFDIKGKLTDAKDAAADFFEKRANPEKFN